MRRKDFGRSGLPGLRGVWPAGRYATTRSNRRFRKAKKEIENRRQQDADLEAGNGRLRTDAIVVDETHGPLWDMSANVTLVAELEGAMKVADPVWTTTLELRQPDQNHPDDKVARLINQLERADFSSQPESAPGWNEQESISRSLFDLIHPHDLSTTSRDATSFLEDATLQQFGDRHRHADGSYHWVIWAAVQYDGGTKAVGCAVTAEKEQPGALRDAEEALRQAQKMAAVGQLASGLAHDFNNLLTVITGNLKLLATRLTQGQIDDLADYIAAAQGASNRAAAITRRLLTFSRQHALDPVPASVNRLITNMQEMIRRTMGLKVAVEVVMAGGIWTTWIDPNQFENALLNLCINARDAMPQGGQLTIETANTWLQEPTARAFDVPMGHYVVLTVSDTGRGMAQQVIDRAFDPFFTTKPSGMGTGLGLSMIYGFVRHSGGQARIKSDEGHGTTICLYFPRYIGEAVEAEDPESPNDLAEAPRAEDGETVLVVDDEPTVRDLVTNVLEALGYKVIEAEDGEAGLKALRSDAPISLLVTDIGLPGGMDGQQMADAARVLQPALKVLFITGYDEAAVLGEAELEPGMQMLAKPFRMEVLARRIKDLLAGE